MKRPRVFISYRTEKQESARLLWEALKVQCGDVFFMAPDHIPLGENFATCIGEALNRCRIMLVIIGKGWCVRESDDDWVYFELKTAFEKKSVRVIPVRVEGAKMPSSLPSSVAELAECQAFEVRADSSFDDDVKRLSRQIGLRGPWSWVRKRIALASMALLIASGGWYVGLNGAPEKITPRDAGVEISGDGGPSSADAATRRCLDKLVLSASPTPIGAVVELEPYSADSHPMLNIVTPSGQLFSQDFERRQFEARLGDRASPDGPYRLDVTVEDPECGQLRSRAVEVWRKTGER